MGELKQNDYGILCTEMYGILHEQAPQDELDFYLSYCEKATENSGVPVRHRTVSGSVFGSGL